MVKGLYSHISEAWKNLKGSVKERLIAWRASDSVVKVKKPLRLDRARALGYKAKKGFIVVRVRVKRGGRKRPRHKKGRRSKRQHVRKVLKMNYQWVAEMRAARKLDNLEVLNSYPIGKDGKHYFYEVIMVDPNVPEIKSDPVINWIVSSKNRKRVERGLTSAAKKSRGLRSKSHTLKVRPSLRAHNRKGK